MLKKLEDYYNQQRILSTNFACKHKEVCEKKSKEKDTIFTGPKSAFVSEGYERGDLPRLLFLSLDSGGGEKEKYYQENKNRLPSTVREFEEFERAKKSDLSTGNHWRRTHELAWHILKRFDPHIKKEDVIHHFAHANSAKCCMNNPNRKKANAVLFRNCKEFLGGELDILLPKIIITQGSEAKEAILSLCPKIIKKFDEYASVVEINLHALFWLHTWHPTNFGKFHQQRSGNCLNESRSSKNPSKYTKESHGWERYADLIKETLPID